MITMDTSHKTRVMRMRLYREAEHIGFSSTQLADLALHLSIPAHYIEYHYGLEFCRDGTTEEQRDEIRDLALHEITQEQLYSLPLTDRAYTLLYNALTTKDLSAARTVLMQAADNTLTMKGDQV